MEEKNSSSILKTIVNKGCYVNLWKMEEKILLTLNSNMEIQMLYYVFFSRNTFCYNLFLIKNDFVSNVLTTINTLRVGTDYIIYYKEPTHTSRLFMNYTDKE